MGCISMSDFLEKAKKHWTLERVKKVTGGKKLLLTPDQAPELLRVMGLLNSDASMSANDVRKYRQINHMLALISDELIALSRQHAKVRVIDIGCGNSYMTLLLVWFFKHKLQHPIECLGIDGNPKVIAASQERAKQLAFEKEVEFQVADIKDFKWEKETRPHVVLALHACDTATDYALAFGIQNKADTIFVAPCCQAELARKWKGLVDVPSAFNPIFRSHHFRREIAAEMTDVLRMLLVRSRGYEVTPTEFVGKEHAMKNTLMTCIRKGSQLQEAKKQYEDLKTALGGSGICLEDLLV